MPSKEYEALVEKVMRDLQYGGTYEQMADRVLSTILAALLEPTEGMLDACGENWYYGGVLWKPMLAASALGEQSE